MTTAESSSMLSPCIHTDESLSEITRIISEASNHYKVLSVDFFDTLVARISPEPVNLFLEVCRRLAGAAQLKRPLRPDAYMIVRQEAEYAARCFSLKERGTTECRLHEIYRHLEQIVRNPQQAAEIEVQAESAFCYVKQGVLSLCKLAAGLGLRVAILSDSYLSSTHLRKILEENGVDTGIFALIATSSDQGCSKADTGLFQHLFQMMGVQADQVLHIGDNETADIARANVVGIKAFHYYRTNQVADYILQRERIIDRRTSRTCTLDSLRVHAARQTATVPPAYQGYFYLGAFHLGPVLARYADWVVAQAKVEGIGKVLASMREAATLAPLIRYAAAASAYPLEVVPCFVSRGGVRQASLIRATADRIHSRLGKRGGKPLSFYEFFRTLEVDPLLTGLAEGQLCMPIDDYGPLIEMMVQSPWKEIIEAKSAELRQLAVAYLAPLVQGHARVILADVGFRGIIQKYIEEIFAAEHISCSLIGCYLTTSRSAAPQVLSGYDIRSYIGECGTDAFLLDALRKQPFFLEQSLNDCCGTVERYELKQGSSVPVLGEGITDPDEVAKIAYLRKGILAFQRRWLETYLAKQASFTDTLLEEIDEYNLAILHRLVAFPGKAEAELLGSLTHDDNDGYTDRNKICSDEVRSAFARGGYNEMEQVTPLWRNGVVSLERHEIIENFFQVWHRHSLG